MSVDGHYRLHEIEPRHWEAEARRCGYDPARAVAHVQDIVARLPDEADALLAICKQEGSATVELGELVDLLKQRCAALAGRYGTSR